MKRLLQVLLWHHIEVLYIVLDEIEERICKEIGELGGEGELDGEGESDEEGELDGEERVKYLKNHHK